MNSGTESNVCRCASMSLLALEALGRDKHKRTVSVTVAGTPPPFSLPLSPFPRLLPLLLWLYRAYHRRRSARLATAIHCYCRPTPTEASVCLQVSPQQRPQQYCARECASASFRVTTMVAGRCVCGGRGRLLFLSTHMSSTLPFLCPLCPLLPSCSQHRLLSSGARAFFELNAPARGCICASPPGRSSLLHTLAASQHCNKTRAKGG